MINMILAMFNLIPVPPLDGSRILAGLLPDSMATPLMRLEPYGLILVGLLIFTGVTGFVLAPIFDIVVWMIQTFIFL